MKYIFILGRDPELSKRELFSYFKAQKLTYTLLRQTEKLLILDLETLPKTTIEELGGTIKIAQVLIESQDIEELEYELNQQNLLIPSEKRVYYSIENHKSELLDFMEEYLKDYFKSQKVKALYKKNLSPTKSKRKASQEEGIEIILFENIIARTIQVSDLAKIKERDNQRPSVNQLGTISIRLAKILLNLAEVKPKQTLLDPFCSSGTILQEALLRRLKVIGSSSNKLDIIQSQQNLDWLVSKYKLQKNFKLHIKPLSKISSFIQKESIDVIITEPEMGPFMKKLPSEAQVKETIKKLVPIYRTFFDEAFEALKPKGRIVMLLPTFRTFDKLHPIEIQKVVRKEHFKQVHNPLPYFHGSSKLRRHIYVFERL